MNKKGPHEIVGLIDSAYNRRDIEAFLEHFHTEVKLYSLPNQDPKYSSKQELRNTYTDLFESSPKLRCEILKRLTCGEYIVDEERITGSSRSSGTVHAIVTYRVVDEKVVQMWIARE